MTYTKEQGKQKIKELVERFRYNLDVYKKSAYNETQVRREFIDPFFEALGWDVSNKQGYAEQYKDVVHEDAIKVGHSTRAPDYSFRIGGQRKFFVEAKKPAVDIKEDVAPSYQLRRYAWSAKLQLSIVTDFEEFSVFNCQMKPNPTDKPGLGRFAYYTFDEYLDKFDEIYDVFSKEAVLKGSFDRYAQSTKGKKGTATVDSEFLKEIESWREQLAKNIALRDPNVSIYELNYSVQKLLDRIIFLRICEDRGIEPYGQLRTQAESSDVYMHLLNHFRLAESKYDSGIFDFDSDGITPALTIDDKVLKTIIQDLYYPKSPYEFSVLGVEILGNVYEQFLGKVIRLTAGHQAKVETKPEVKKAGGVYYTPQYIVEYIVENTVGKLIAGKTPEEIAHIKILDPACGSGSFLIGAYTYLLRYHRDWYVSNKPKKHKEAVFQVKADEWYLTTAEKKRILLDNIFGVDIDSQAVEVTKMSLLLKVLEHESRESIDQQMKLGLEGVLPNLGDNIKCGNSLIGPEYYDLGQQGSLFDEAEMRRVNVFDWNDDVKGFGEILKKGGFDCVVGNPPYVRIQTMKEWAPTEVKFYKKHFVAASKGNYDIYVIFVERALQLLNVRGLMGYILPHKFFQAKYGQPLRELTARGEYLGKIVHFGDQQVFDGASTYTCLLFLDRAGNKSFRYVKVRDLNAWRISGDATDGKIHADKVKGGEWNFVVGPEASLFERMREIPIKLGDVAIRMFQGSITSADTVYLFKEYQNENEDIVDVWSKELNAWIKIERAVLKTVVRSGNISRYSANPTALVLFPYEVQESNARLYTPTEMQEQYPLAWAYLKQNKRLLEGREKGKFKDLQWYRFGRTQNLGMWEQPKLMIPYMITNLAAYYDKNDNFYFINVTTGGYGITIDETMFSYLYLCGLLNSQLLNFYLKQVTTNFRGGYFAANKQFIEQLPILTINFDDPATKAQHDKLVALVENMLELQKKYHDTRMERDKELYGRQIKIVDTQIDRRVYELYGLTEEEVKIVEENL
ncbi:Type I restriction-modification system, DNA methylase subunit [Methanophagales archaeon]|nr:Type I restriction-modification system, DNA methylase subunit [Methanophagales archaeon]